MIHASSLIHRVFPFKVEISHRKDDDKKKPFHPTSFDGDGSDSAGKTMVEQKGL